MNADLAPSPLRLDPARAALLVVDLQERLAAAMDAAALDRVVRNTIALVEGAKVLGLPVIVTEQYPKGIGPTLAAIRAALPDDARPIEKVDFSCAAVPAVREALARVGRDQLVVVGMEAHVCVYQTARDLAAEGRHVFVPHDAVLSRADENRRIGLSLAERAGAAVTATETVLFDLLGRAGTPAFKEISRLIK